jgi:hypothetical protein
MEFDQILRVLRDDLVAAQKRSDVASRRLSEVLSHAKPDSVERVRHASDKYGLTQKEVIVARSRLNCYLDHGKSKTPKLDGS